MKFRSIYFLFWAISGVFGEQLYFEDFGSGSFPTGYTYEGNWQVSGSWTGNDTPPAAVYNWSPQQSNFEHHLVTAPIDVGENDGILVMFDFALDFYAQDELNGLRIAYDGGGGWVDVLDYAIGPESGGDVDVSRRTESFTAEMQSGSDLKVRFTAYGDNSWAINGWIVDNITVLTLPKLTSVTIASLNEDPTTATSGSYIDLMFTTDSDLTGEPFVQVNGNSTELFFLENRTWQARYTVLETDPDGPLEFTIDFTDLNGVSGQTVKQTTDGSTVIVDNSAPPSFTVGLASASGGNVFTDNWNSTNTTIQLEVDVPQDSAVASFDYNEGNSILFDGSNDEVLISGSSNYQFTNAFTVEAWVKPASWSDYEGILSYGMDNGGGSQAGFGFVYFATGWRFFLKTTSNNIEFVNMAETSTPSNQWTHLAATYDNDKIRLYRNGSVIDSTDATGDVNWSGIGSNVTIGSFTRNGTTKYFHGNIDEVRFWDYKRTGAQIKASREVTFTGSETGLVGYWTMDEGTGTETADLTSSANAGSLSGATWATSNSPIDFKTPNYDTGVIVGSMFQLRGRIGSNTFESFGTKDTITTADYTAGSKSVSAPELDFESIIDFDHGETAQISALLYDVAGNYSLGDTSSTNMLIDIIAEAPSPVSITSNNSFNHLAKIGDQVTITMTYPEDVDLPAVTVDGNDATESDLGGNQYQAVYTLDGNETEGALPFQYSTNDFRGNPGTGSGSTDGTTVVFDKTSPSITSFKIKSTNADTSWAKVGDTIRVDFGGDEIFYQSDLSLAGSSVDLLDSTGAIYNGSSECSGGEIVTSNLKLWLDANDVDGDGLVEGLNESTLTGSDVAIWTDKSGNNADVIQFEDNGIPTLVQNQFNGNATLQFNRDEEDCLIHDLGANNWTASEYSIFVVFQQIGTPSQFDSFFSNGDVNNNNHFQITQKNGYFKFLSGGEIDFEPWDNDLKLYGVIGNSEGTKTIVDGTVANSSTNTNGRSFDKYKVNRNRLDFQYDNSYISEILLYDRELTETELTKTYKYLGNKYGQNFTNDSTSIYSIKEMLSTDPEGKVAINYTFNDCAGNDGETLTETTNNSYVIFDKTAPADFTVGTITSTNGNVIDDVWNSTNTGLEISVPIDSDSTLENGWVQIWVKVGSNAFELFGDQATLENSDLGQNKTLTFTSDQVENVTGFAEEDTLIFKAVISDRPGNTTEGSESLNRLVIDQTPPTLSNIHIESNNSFDSTKAKVDDLITLTFSVDELLQTPLSTISQSAATVTDLGGLSWSATYTMTDSNDEGVIPFSIDSLKDARGNPASSVTSTSDGSQVIFDKTKPTLNNVNIRTYNTNNIQWAKVGDYGRVYTYSSEPLRSISATISGNTTSENWYSSSEFEFGHTFVDTDDEGIVPIEIVFSDSVGNIGDTIRASTDGTQIIFDKTNPSDFTVGDAIATGGNIVSSFWNSTNTGLDIIVPIASDSTLDSGWVEIRAKVGSNSFEKLGSIVNILSTDVGNNKTISISGDSVRAITGYTENDTIFFNAIIYDIPGNNTLGTASETSLIIDETIPSLSYISYKSNFTDTTLATIGHEITLSLKSDEEIQTPSGTISGNNATATDQSANNWEMTYTMQDGDSEGVIPFQIDILTDVHGNPTASGFETTTDNSVVTFDSTPPTLTFVTIASNQADTTWAKVGDTVRVKYIADELISEESVTVVNQSVSSTKSTSNVYSAKYEMAETDPEGEIEFEIIVTDSVDIVGTPVTETTNGSAVIFDRTAPSLSYVHIESNNSNNATIAITGDIVTLTFTPNEPLVNDSIVVTIAGEVATVTQDGDNYISALTVDGNEPDGIFSFTIDFKDRAGNSGTQITNTTDDSYVNHDVLPPEIQYVSISSNNTDTTWAKVGDSIFVSFNASEILDNIVVTVGGNSVAYQNLSTAKYKGLYEMTEDDSEGEIEFNITYTDLGGAAGPPADTTTNESKVKFDKTNPELSSIKMATNNVYGDSLAGIGTVDTLQFEISESYRELNVSLAGENIVPSEDGFAFLATYTFDGTEDDGWVPFSITMTDSAGNSSEEATATQDGSRVRFDGTLPELPSVIFWSNNANDSTLCIPSDTLFLQYTESEVLRNATIKIAGNDIDYIDTTDGVYKAYYGMTGTEDEGFIPISIIIEDWVGNMGDTISTTTNGSTVLFDMTPPDMFTLGNISPQSGIEVPGYWNSYNETINIIVPMANDATLTDGNIQIQVSFTGAFHNLGEMTLIEETDLDNEKIITIQGADFEENEDYVENGNATFKAIIWDKAGNSTTGNQSTTIIHIDETIPTLQVVTQQTNNAVADSLAKVGDTDTLSFNSSEGLDSVSVQLFNHDATLTGGNQSWNGLYTFQDEDNDGTVTFNIIYGDTAGNLGEEISQTTDGSWVRFDGTIPTLSSVSFHSTNNVESDLAIVGDTLYLDFVSNENLRTSSVTIADNIADTTYENNPRVPYRSWRVLDGTEIEGQISFQISFTDDVGNVGIDVDSTTDNSSILFDMTPPQAFELDTVYSVGGTVTNAYWNSTNDSLAIIVPVPDDDESLINGGFQPQVKFGEGSFINLGDTILIESVDGDGTMPLRISADVFESVEGFDEGENAQFTAIVWDRAGNQTVGTTDNTIIHIDETIPLLNEVTISSDNELSTKWVTIGNTISLSYEATEGLQSPTTILLLDTINTSNTNNGREWSGEKQVLEDDPDDVVPFSISFIDSAGNEGLIISETTDGSLIHIDKTSPTISDILEGREGIDIKYYNNSDSLTLYWTRDDTLSGIRESYYALGSDSILVDVQSWTLGSMDEYGGWNNLNLSNDTRYFGGAFVRDSAGNYSDTIWGNGIFIDTQLPDTGFIVDGNWVMDVDYTPDSSQLLYRWNNFSDNVGVEYFQLSIGTGDEQSNIYPYTNIGNDDTITIKNLSLIRDTLYTTYLFAVDSAGNSSDTVNTDGVYFDDTFPMVNRISPDVVQDSAGFLSVLNKDTITIKFNRPIYTYEIDGSIATDSTFQFDHAYNDSIITVTWDNALLSYDTVTIVIDSAMAYNTLVVSDTLIFYSKLWADLNNDYDITVDDILTFNQNWPDVDLGPFTGTPPHVRPSPDGEVDLTDLSTFAKMWHWRYFDLAFDTTDTAARIVSDMNMRAQGNIATIPIPKNTVTVELLIGESNLDVNKMRLLKPTSSSFLFSSMDTVKKMIQFSAADYRGMDTTLQMIIPKSDEDYFEGSIQFEFKDIDGKSLEKGFTNFITEILPDQFSVYPNFPNPFNPITTIRYDLPKARDIQMVVFDLLGRTIYEQSMNQVPAGKHQIQWNGINQFGKSVSSGVYFIQIIAGQDSNIQKVMLLK